MHSLLNPSIAGRLERKGGGGGVRSGKGKDAVY